MRVTIRMNVNFYVYVRYITLTTVNGKAKSAPPDNRKPQAWLLLLLESFMSTSTIMICSIYQKIDICNEVQEIKKRFFQSITINP